MAYLGDKLAQDTVVDSKLVAVKAQSFEDVVAGVSEEATV